MDKLVQPELKLPGRFTPNEADLRRAMEERSKLRAFEGAPPMVPHPIDSISSAGCLTCHAESMRIRDQSTPKMSHDHLTQCTQCHVPAKSSLEHAGAAVPSLTDWLAENETADARPASTQRPPRSNSAPDIPHAVWMREDCASCHGPPSGHIGLWTRHFRRDNCMKCHDPSSTLDPPEVLKMAPEPTRRAER